MDNGDNMIYEWFDELWKDMIKFIQEHPYHIVIPADNPIKEHTLGFCAFWDHPSPGCPADRLGIDISDINIEAYFNIRISDVLKSIKCNRVPKIVLDINYPKTQMSRINLSREVVRIAHRKNIIGNVKYDHEAYVRYGYTRNFGFNFSLNCIRTSPYWYRKRKINNKIYFICG